MRLQRVPGEATSHPRPRAVTLRRHPEPKDRAGGWEEHPKEWWLRRRRRALRSYPTRRSGMAVVRRYPSSKVRSSGCALLEQP